MSFIPRSARPLQARSRMQPRVKRGRIAPRSNTPPTTALLHRNTNLSRPNHLHPHHSLRPHPQHRSHLCPTLFPRPSPLDLRCTYRAHPQAPPLPDLNQKQSTPDTNLSPDSPHLSHRLIRPAPSLTHNKHSPAPNSCPAPSYSPVPRSSLNKHSSAPSYSPAPSYSHTPSHAHSAQVTSRHRASRCVRLPA